MGDMADMVNNDIGDILFDYGGIKTCNICGESGLFWVNCGSKRCPEWRLSSDEGVHSCLTKVENIGDRHGTEK